MNAHRRQFLLGSEPKQVAVGWQTLGMGKSAFLSYCPELPVSTVRDRDGNAWYLLGLAIQTGAEMDDPLTEIGKSTSEEVKEAYKRWNGRWLLIGNNEIHMDCFGLLGCFYTSINGKKWISSSLAVLKEIGNFSARQERLEHMSGLEFYPLPLTRLEGVSKLFPSQLLNISTLIPERRTLPQPVEGLSYNEILDRLMEKMKVSLLNLAKLKRKIYLPLTAGYDSRLILAAAQHSGIAVNTYTAGHPDITDCDVKIPFKLAETAGFDHRFIKMNRSDFSKEKEELYDLHTAGDSNDIDRKRFSHGQWDGFSKGDILLRGGGLEIGRCIAWYVFRPHFTIETLLEGSSPEHIHLKHQAFSKWITWVNQTPAAGFDWRDRYYWEQRVGGWLSAVEQSLDITGTERFYLVNSHEIVSLLLTPPVKLRRTFQTHLELIKEMAPDLLLYPFNPVPAFARLKKKFSRVTISDFYRVIEKKAEIYFDRQRSGA